MRKMRVDSLDKGTEAGGEDKGNECQICNTLETQYFVQ